MFSWCEWGIISLVCSYDDTRLFYTIKKNNDDDDDNIMMKITKLHHTLPSVAAACTEKCKTDSFTMFPKICLSTFKSFGPR